MACASDLYTMAHMLTTTEEMQSFITKAIQLGLDKVLPILEAKNTKEDKEVYNLVEAAKYLNMSPHTLRKKVDEQKIAYIQDRRILQFRRKHLNDYLDKFTVNSKSV